MSTDDDDRCTPENVLLAYRHGFFPMANPQDRDAVEWHQWEPRGIMPLDDAFHVPKRLGRRIRQKPYVITFDKDFRGVISACSLTREIQERWINPEIIAAYTTLHDKGYAHSAEAWKDGKLVGGVYGVAMGSAFFGESMFATADDASKIALVHLVGRLRTQGFTLFDTQMVTPTTEQFGAHSIELDDYLARLKVALRKPSAFSPAPPKSNAGAAFKP